MTKIIGVRFRTAGKIYFFDPLEFEIKRGDHVIVETARGIEFGTAVSDVREVDDASVQQPVKPILRVANERDREQAEENKRKEREAFKIGLEKIQKHELEMKLIDVEYTFDNNKILFYFTADGRVDFRELVKDLAGVFRTRIELRQIGVRDETKIRGGIGICGRPLCCHSYLSDFIPVSIKMAKEQNLSLNPTKISGVCGRLMCCLKNEEETYEELNRRLPGIGDNVLAEDGTRGVVQSVNVLRQTVKVVVDKGDTKEVQEYDVKELHFKRKHTKKERMEFSPEELKELERLESEEIRGSIDDDLLGDGNDSNVTEDPASFTLLGPGRTAHGDRRGGRRGEGRDRDGRERRDRSERGGYHEKRDHGSRLKGNERSGRKSGGKGDYRGRDRHSEGNREEQHNSAGSRENRNNYRRGKNQHRYNRHDNKVDVTNILEE